MITKHRQSGFTTIELLVVIAVIAVLAAGVIAAANRMRNQSQEQQARSILNEVGSVEEQIASERGGEYEDTVANDSRLVDINERLEENFEFGVSGDDGTTDGNTPVLKIEKGSGGQNRFAAAIPRPNNASGSFCVDSDGNSFGYNNTDASTVISGGQCDTP